MLLIVEDLDFRQRWKQWQRSVMSIQVECAKAGIVIRSCIFVVVVNRQTREVVWLSAWGCSSIAQGFKRACSKMRSQNLLDRVRRYKMNIVIKERRGETKGC